MTTTPPFPCDGRPVKCNKRFADDIDLIFYLQDLTDRVISQSRAYGTEVNTEKTKIVTNNTNGSTAVVSTKARS